VLAVSALAATLTITSTMLTSVTHVVSSPVTCTLTNSPAKRASDAYVDESLASSNFGSAATLNVKSSLALLRQYTFIQFNLSACSIPAGANVQSATLSLVLVSAPTTSRTYTVSRASGAWSETKITWNDQPAVDSTPSLTFSVGTTSNVSYTLTVTRDIQDFVAGTVGNNGWRIIDSDSLLGTASFAGQFASSENTTTANRPTLQITYVT
jgi:hypothetical protein